MDSLEQTLSILASLAAVFGTVISYLQYRVRRHPSAAQPPPRTTDGGPPSVVRVAAFWVVVDAVATVLLLYAVFSTVMSDRHSFGFPVPDLPEPVVLLAPVGLVALIGIASVPVAIQRAGGLRDGDSLVRGKLLGVAARDLFVGVALAVGAQVFADDLPASVSTVITVYLTYSILSAFGHLCLLLHAHTRGWVERNRLERASGGRAR